MEYLDFRSENDIQLEVSPTQPETKIPVKASECIYCRQFKVCNMYVKPCFAVSILHTCKLP